MKVVEVTKKEVARANKDTNVTKRDTNRIADITTIITTRDIPGGKDSVLTLKRTITFLGPSNRKRQKCYQQPIWKISLVNILFKLFSFEDREYRYVTLHVPGSLSCPIAPIGRRFEDPKGIRRHKIQAKSSVSSFIHLSRKDGNVKGPLVKKLFDHKPHEVSAASLIKRLKLNKVKMKQAFLITLVDSTF